MTLCGFLLYSQKQGVRQEKLVFKIYFADNKLDITVGGEREREREMNSNVSLALLVVIDFCELILKYLNSFV